MELRATAIESNSQPDALDPVEVFRERAEARAYLVELGELPLHNAVDGLQADAERDGLVALIGQDGVQGILAAAFGERP